MAAIEAATAMQGSAYAQAPAVPLAQPQMNTLIVPNGGKSANDNNNYRPAPLPGAVATPTPGTMVIRLNGNLGRVWSWHRHRPDPPHRKELGQRRLGHLHAVVSGLRCPGDQWAAVWRPGRNP